MPRSRTRKVVMDDSLIRYACSSAESGRCQCVYCQSWDDLIRCLFVAHDLQKISNVLRRQRLTIETTETMADLLRDMCSTRHTPILKATVKAAQPVLVFDIDQPEPRKKTRARCRLCVPSLVLGRAHRLATQGSLVVASTSESRSGQRDVASGKFSFTSNVRD
jgi:hypothetical protein